MFLNIFVEWYNPVLMKDYDNIKYLNFGDNKLDN